MKFTDAHGDTLEPDAGDDSLAATLASVAPAEAALAARALVVTPILQAAAEARRLARFYHETATLLEDQAHDLETRR